MTVSGSEERNRRRVRAIVLAREFRDLFARAIVPLPWWYRWLFAGEKDELRMTGEHVLADLRDFCGATARSHFDPDPLVMARRAGRMDVWLRIQNYLNLNEEQVRNLMVIDDGY